ncbi:MAG TPA: hypothetical protein VF499_12830 [Afipia sp.]
MPVETDEQYYARRAQQELDLAQASDDPAVKAAHLNMAAEYATRRERSVAPHRSTLSLRTKDDRYEAGDEAAPERGAPSGMGEGGGV